MVSGRRGRPAVRTCRQLQDPEGRPRRRDPVVGDREWALAANLRVRGRGRLRGGRRPWCSARPPRCEDQPPRGRVRVRPRDRSRRAPARVEDPGWRGRRLLVGAVHQLRYRLAGSALRPREGRVTTNPLPRRGHRSNGPWRTAAAVRDAGRVGGPDAFHPARRHLDECRASEARRDPFHSRQGSVTWDHVIWANSVPTRPVITRVNP